MAFIIPRVALDNFRYGSTTAENTVINFRLLYP
jgi:hypothetical protein